MPRMRQLWVRPRSAEGGSLGLSLATRQTILDVPTSSTEMTALFLAESGGKRGGSSLEFMCGRLLRWPCAPMLWPGQPPLPRKVWQLFGQADAGRATERPCREYDGSVEFQQAAPALLRHPFPAAKRQSRLSISASSGARRHVRQRRYVHASPLPPREGPYIRRSSHWRHRLRRREDERTAGLEPSPKRHRPLPRSATRRRFAKGQTAPAPRFRSRAGWGRVW